MTGVKAAVLRMRYYPNDSPGSELFFDEKFLVNVFFS
jgi:hypothetical protein